MWNFNFILCLFFISVSVSYYVPHRFPTGYITKYMLSLHDTIVSEINFKRPTNLHNFTCHINEFNNYVRNLISSYYDDVFVQYRLEANDIAELIRKPKWISYKDFSALRDKYEWNEYDMKGVNRAVEKTESLWGRFQNLKAKNISHNFSTEEFYPG
uniref:Cathepsin propeptide inhibitor domain-containing protein n=1 Tax=Clastoptera arizonana TaxID=38151 RepID=A0A1B6CPN1_9HEMI